MSISYWTTPSIRRRLPLRCRTLLYLLDANVLIRAHQDYYPLDRVRGFWTWICDQAGGHDEDALGGA